MGLLAQPQSSPLQSFLYNHELQRDSPHPPHLYHLALQVAHNLRFQHGWKDVRIHEYSSHSSEGDTQLPRPLLSGIPPKRLYVHPDEQIEMLQKQKRAQEENGEDGMPGLDLMESEREWVLPSHLREKWSLRRFGEVFDCISTIPATEEGGALFYEEAADGGGGAEQGDEAGVNEWRGKMPKRLLLATLDDDSTVVYYIVHDGLVKPRQN